MCRRPVALVVKVRIVGFTLFEHVVDCCQQHSGNGDDGFLVPSTFLESKIAVTNFRELLGTNRTKSTLYQQGFDISSGSADSGSFLLSGTLVVLRRKTSPGAKMLRGG